MNKLVWTEETHPDEFDPQYTKTRTQTAHCGSIKVAQVFIAYGDENSANTERGTVSSVLVKGKFKKWWSSNGYTWRGDYTPALVDESIPKAWVESRWAVFIDKLNGETDE